MSIRCLALTSAAHHCGIADYHNRLAPHVPAITRTLTLPTDRVLRDRPLPLLRLRSKFRALAAAADAHDVVLLQLLQSWNAFRLGEFLLPTFLGRLRKPLVVVMHEWPDPVEDEMPRSGVAGQVRRVAAAAMRRIDFAGLGFDQWLREAFFPRVAHFVVHAEHLKLRLIDAGVSPDRISFSLLPPYEPPETPRDSALSFLPNSDRRIVLLFGFPHPRKGYDIAVRALAKLPKDTVLLMVGSAEGEFRRKYLDELLALAHATNTEDRFIVAGEVSDSLVAGIFRRADLVLSPVRYATGSATIAYAIATGVPVVASDLPSVTALRQAGAGVVTFESGDVDACVAALRRVLDDDDYRERLRGCNREYAANHTFAHLGASVDEQLQRAAHGAAAYAGGFAPAGALR